MNGIAAATASSSGLGLGVDAEGDIEMNAGDDVHVEGVESEGGDDFDRLERPQSRHTPSSGLTTKREFLFFFFPSFRHVEL